MISDKQVEYSDHIVINTSKWGVRLDFTQPEKPDTDKRKIVSSIGMSQKTAELLYLLLKDSLITKKEAQND